MMQPRPPTQPRPPQPGGSARTPSAPTQWPTTPATPSGQRDRQRRTVMEETSDASLAAIVPKTVTEWRDRLHGGGSARARLGCGWDDPGLPCSEVAECRQQGIQQRRVHEMRWLESMREMRERTAAELREILATHAPNLLSGIPTMTIKWEGREQELLSKVRQHCSYRLWLANGGSGDIQIVAGKWQHPPTASAAESDDYAGR